MEGFGWYSGVIDLMPTGGAHLVMHSPVEIGRLVREFVTHTSEGIVLDHATEHDTATHWATEVSVECVDEGMSNYFAAALAALFAPGVVTGYQSRSVKANAMIKCTSAHALNKREAIRWVHETLGMSVSDHEADAFLTLLHGSLPRLTRIRIPGLRPNTTKWGCETLDEYRQRIRTTLLSYSAPSVSSS